MNLGDKIQPVCLVKQMTIAESSASIFISTYTDPKEKYSKDTERESEFLKQGIEAEILCKD